MIEREAGGKQPGMSSQRCSEQSRRAMSGLRDSSCAPNEEACDNGTWEKMGGVPLLSLFVLAGEMPYCQAGCLMF